MLFLNPRLRAFLLVAVLAVAAAVAGLMVLSRQGALASAPADPQVTTSTPKALEQSSRSPHPSAQPAAAPAAPAAPKPAAAPETNGLPSPVREGLAANRVVVVSLFDPEAKIDTVATREASAGAALAGARFVALDVTKGLADGLHERYGVTNDPAVLVLRPPGDLIVRIDGFADRDTVAQAAANASQ
jgi:hypothetical protein